MSAAVMVSNSVSTAGPSASTGWEAVASSAARKRSSSTGWAKRSIASDFDSGVRGDLFDGCARTNARLNFLGTQQGWNLDLDLGLARVRAVPAQCGVQAVVGTQHEHLARVDRLADDALAIDVESDDLEFPHADLLGAYRAPYCVIDS